jgi:hypothetical protein
MSEQPISEQPKREISPDMAPEDLEGLKQQGGQFEARYRKTDEVLKKEYKVAQAKARDYLVDKYEKDFKNAYSLTRSVKESILYMAYKLGDNFDESAPVIQEYLDTRLEYEKVRMPGVLDKYKIAKQRAMIALISNSEESKQIYEERGSLEATFKVIMDKNPDTVRKNSDLNEGFKEYKGAKGKVEKYLIAYSNERGDLLDILFDRYEDDEVVQNRLAKCKRLPSRNSLNVLIDELIKADNDLAKHPRVKRYQRARELAALI